MLKPGSLRAHLTAAVPSLATNPHNLIVVARGGRAQTTGTGTLSFEYAYTLQVIVLDYAGHADAIVVPVLAWIARNQPELFDNPERTKQALRFDVEYLTAHTIDLALEIDLTERVLVRQRPNAEPGALELHHVPEPPHPAHIDKPEHWSLWLRVEKLAEWDHDPR